MQTHNERATVIQVGEREAMERLWVQVEFGHITSDLPNCLMMSSASYPFLSATFVMPVQTPVVVLPLSSSQRGYVQLLCRSFTLPKALRVLPPSALLNRHSVRFPLWTQSEALSCNHICQIKSRLTPLRFVPSGLAGNCFFSLILASICTMIYSIIFRM